MHADFDVSFASHRFECVDKGFKENELVDVVIRPEDIKLSTESGMLCGIVNSVVFKGVHYEMEVSASGFTWTVHSTLMEPVGTEVYLNILPNDIHIMKKVAENE